MAIDPESIRFNELYSAAVIQKRVQALGAEISKDLAGEPATMICVLKGAVMFAADLVRAVKAPLVLDFMTIASYEGTQSTGSIKVTQDLSMSIKGKNVIVIEDIIDTGRTLDYLLKDLKTRGPKSVKLCTLLDKPAAREVDIKIDYCGFQIENQFVIGYGLDLDQRWRELPFIAQVQA